jgi:membrane-associated phospholipid phosphatase
MSKIIYIVLILLLCTPVHDEDYLSVSEISYITLASIGFDQLGNHIIKQMDSSTEPRISGPLPLEHSIQKFLGGEFRSGKSNFLDKKNGGEYTPIAGIVFLAAVDLSWSRGNKQKILLQDLFLFTSGLVTTKGITNITKGLFRRERPYVYLNNESTNNGGSSYHSSNYQSFFSGHTSTAFYSMTYLNLRIRSIMRDRMTSDEFNKYHWLPPVVLYGWSSFAGWSRMHAYKHYLSDVIAGAFVGYIIGDLFYSFGQKNHNQNISISMFPNLQIKIRI